MTLLLQILNNGHVVEQIEFNNLYEISKKYDDNISYYHLKQIYLNSMNKTTSYINSKISYLFNTIHIIDNNYIF